MLYRIVSIVFPLFAVDGGFPLCPQTRPGHGGSQPMNVEVFMPALIFAALAGKSFNLADNAPIALGAVVVAGSGLLAWPLARPLGIDSRALTSTAMFNNVAQHGLAA